MIEPSSIKHMIVIVNNVKAMKPVMKQHVSLPCSVLDGIVHRSYYQCNHTLCGHQEEQWVMKIEALGNYTASLEHLFAEITESI